ncbi:MAG TPA: insulinase family protein [Gemmatimonadales bacterium]
MKSRIRCSARAAIMTLAAVAVINVTAVAQYPTEPPPAAPLTPLRFPPFREARLGNGLTIVLVENHDLPIVSISLSIPTGSVSEPAGRQGLAGMVAELMTKGTATRSAEEIAATIEGVGGSLNAGAGQDFFSISSTVLTDNVDLAFTLLSDVLLNATYPDAELELARTRALSGLRLEKSDPGALAGRYFARAIYGDHPYGLRENETTIQAITREEVQAFAREHLRPGGTMLVVAGDMRLDRVRDLANQYLGSWSGTVPARSYGAPPAARATEILLVHRPGSEQSNIVVGNLALRPGAPTYYAARIANKVLGDGVDARLFQILREEKSWTYGSYSNLNRPFDVGRFQATAEVRTSVTDSALTELLHQLRRIRSEPISQAEMDAARGYLIGSFPLTVQTPQQIAGQVSTQKRLNLGDDYLQKYRERLAAVTAVDAQRAAMQIIRPDSAVILVVGDGQQIYEPLTAIAPVRIIDTDGHTLTPADLTPEITAVTLDASQLAPRRDSLAVLVQGTPFGGMTTEIRLEGDELVYLSKTAIPAAGVNQETTVRMAVGTLVLRSVHQVGQFQGASGETNLRVAGGRITGNAQTPQPGGTIKETAIDTVLAAGVLASEQLQALLPAMPLAEGATITISVLDSEDATITPYTVKVEAVEDVTVLAGTFAVFRVSMSGGSQQFTFYVTRDTPRRIVKMEIVGQPVAFELVQ